MHITKQNEEDKLILFLDGKLDTLTAPQLDAALKVAYVSSAGLRVLVSTYKRVMDKGGFEISHVNGTVLDVFEATGFSKLLNII